MAAQVIWAPEAARHYEVIIHFLMDVWNVAVALEFVEMVQDVEVRLAHTPEMGSPTSGDNSMRRFVLHKNVLLYYRYDAALNVVELANFFDPRQNPDKLKL